MFYAWFLDQCYLSGTELKTKTGPTGEVLNVLFESLSAAEFENFLMMWEEFKKE